MHKAPMLGFRVYLDESDEYNQENYRELTDEEIIEARFLMTHDGQLVRDESFIRHDTGEFVRYVGHPKDVTAIPRYRRVDSSTRQQRVLTRGDIEEHLVALRRPYRPLTRLELGILTVPRIVDAVRWHLINTLKQVIAED